MAHKYEITAKSAMQWAASELEHVGRIASLADPDMQYAYAMSTLNGMAHLKDALYELVIDPEYEHHHIDLQKTHDAVVRTMKHLKATYNLDLDAIRAFNTRGTLSNLGYLEEDVGNAGQLNQNQQNQGNYAQTNVVSQDGGKRRKTRYRSRRRVHKSRRT